MKQDMAQSDLNYGNAPLDDKEFFNYQKSPNLFPEPLPLIDRRMIQGKEEEDLFRKGRGFFKNQRNAKSGLNDSNNKRGKLQNEDDEDFDYYSNIDTPDIQKLNPGEKAKERCRHREIKDFKCTDCDFVLKNFRSFFDSGNIQTYIRVLFLTESEQIIANEPLIKRDLIFQCYRPTNIIQMREYILFLIHKNLRSVLKKDPSLAPEVKRLCSTDFEKQEFSLKLKSYLATFADQKSLLRSSNTFNPEHQPLIIDSLFESGNLECAYKHQGRQEYDLFINVDSNTRGHQQWYFFRVRNMKSGIKYRFNIKNFTKGDSLYKKGMKILVKSKRRAKLTRQTDHWQGWEFVDDSKLSEMNFSRTPHERSPIVRGLYKEYFKEDEAKQENKKKISSKKHYHQLSFALQFDYQNDTVYIAYSRPYIFSQIMIDTLKIESELRLMTNVVDYSNSSYQDSTTLVLPQFTYQRENLCLTESGMPVPIITLSSNQGKQNHRKQALIISSRVHPGETNASYVFDGFFKFITNPFQSNQYSQIVQSLRESYVIKIIPCLNPDGVSCGNYRTSLAGVDLNRQWISPHPQLHSTIFHTKRMMENLSKEREILLYCDMHGHSKKKNAFIYGCNTAAEGGFNSWTKVRLFPRILAKNTFVFNLKDCKFKVEKSKLGTARVVVWKQFKVTNSFTLENSFYGYQYGEEEVKEFTPQEFRNLGMEICKSIWEYKEVCKSIQKELNITKGWLKPKLLLEVTGMPAAERVKQEMKDANKRIKNIIQDSPTQQQSLQSQVVQQPSFNQQKKISSKRELKPQPSKMSSFKIDTVQQQKNDPKMKSAIQIQAFWKMINQRRKYSLLKLQQSIKFQTIQSLNQESIMKSIDQTSFSGDESSLSDIDVEQSIPIDYTQSYSKESLFQKSQMIALDNTKTSNVKHLSLSQIKSPTEREKLDWRSYFTIQELEEAYHKILAGQDPTNEEVINPDSDGSDSCPSEDNLDIEELYTVIYVRKKFKQQEIKEKIENEQKFIKEFQRYLNRQIRQIKKKGSNQLESSLETNRGNQENSGDEMNQQIQKLKVILRSKSKEAFEDASRVEKIKAVIKQNRSFEQQPNDSSTLNSDQSMLLRNNLFLQNDSINQTNIVEGTYSRKNPKLKNFLSQERDKNQVMNHENSKSQTAQQQLKQRKGSGQDDKTDTQSNKSNLKFASRIQQQVKAKDAVQQKYQMKTPLAQRRLKSLESATDNLNENSVSEYPQQQNMSITQSQTKPSTANQTVKVFTRDQLRIRSQEKQQPQSPNMNQSFTNTQQSANNNTQLSHFSYQTVFLQNQYPMLPLLNMQGTNIQKGVDKAHEQQHHAYNRKESLLIQQQNTTTMNSIASDLASKMVMKDYLNESTANMGDLRKQSLHANKNSETSPSLQRIQTAGQRVNTALSNANLGNSTQSQFFTKRIKSKSPEQNQRVSTALGSGQLTNALLPSTALNVSSQQSIQTLNENESVLRTQRAAAQDVSTIQANLNTSYGGLATVNKASFNPNINKAPQTFGLSGLMPQNQQLPNQQHLDKFQRIMNIKQANAMKNQLVKQQQIQDQSMIGNQSFGIEGRNVQGIAQQQQNKQSVMGTSGIVKQSQSPGPNMTNSKLQTVIQKSTVPLTQRRKVFGSQSPHQPPVNNSNAFVTGPNDNPYQASSNNAADTSYQHPNARVRSPLLNTENLGSGDEHETYELQNIKEICNEMMITRYNQQSYSSALGNRSKVSRKYK